jgi:hypothetical protein
VRQTRGKCTRIALRYRGKKPHESCLLVRQGRAGRALEVVKRPWKIDRFGGRRMLNEFLRGPVRFFTELHKGHKGWAQPILL